jgi:hypothetical protein
MRHDLELLARLGPAEYARRLKRTRRPSKQSEEPGRQGSSDDPARGEELLRAWLAPRKAEDESVSPT